MSINGVLVLVIAIVAFNWIARPVEAFFLCVLEWRNTKKSEQKEMILCAVAVSLFFLIICSAPTVYQTFFKVTRGAGL